MLSDRSLQRLWYQRQPLWLFVLLAPLSCLFFLLVSLRRALYRMRVLRSQKVGVPVIIVGNITVGGTGKTPFVGWLARRIEASGARVAVVLRGYGGDTNQTARQVTPAMRVDDVGDEALIHAARSASIVVVGADRVAAARLAVSLGAEVIVCDDGLQHYRLHRDCEICVLDERRGTGNGWLLPAGPLREPASRLRRVDLIVRTVRNEASAGQSGEKEVRSYGRIHRAISLMGNEERDLRSFADEPIHALAGIGHPEAFFSALRHAGLSIHEHVFPDHATYTRRDIDFPDDRPVLMTEKDAVKCRSFADARHWFVPLQVALEPADELKLDRMLEPLLRSTHRTR